MKYPTAFRFKVLDRDNYSCAMCGRRGVQVHEIVPRSRFGKTRKHICFSEKNMVSLCVECHADAHNEDTRRALLKLMQEKFGYEYPEEEFRRYVDV